MITEILAVARATRLMTEDEITAPVRKKIERAAGDAPLYSPRERLATLVTCSLCTSMWAAAGVLLASRSSPGRALVKMGALSEAAIWGRTVVDAIEHMRHVQRRPSD